MTTAGKIYCPHPLYILHFFSLTLCIYLDYGRCPPRPLLARTLHIFLFGLAPSNYSAFYRILRCFFVFAHLNHPLHVTLRLPQALAHIPSRSPLCCRFALAFLFFQTSSLSPWLFTCPMIQARLLCIPHHITLARHTRQLYFDESCECTKKNC